MCGISGIINKNNSAVNKNEIKNINNLILHRGPDGEGFYIKNNFAFGHRRLSIIDISNDGAQPMNYLDRYTITYNGEVYNYLEIRRNLLEYGYTFRSHTDTEVILASYDKWGSDCVNRFNGMWAFAIYDKETEIIFCSRDRFGIKPFYYTEVNDKFIFGSEIKQLLEFYKNNICNKNVLIDFIVTGIQEHTNETFFKNIYKLEQSHNLIYNLKNNTYKIYKYYCINFKDSNLSLEESIEYYKNELERAIDYRLRSDVKVGTCLSGGLDSSTIATIASKKYKIKTNDKFIAIHAKSTEKSSDESFFAKIVAEESGLDLITIKPTNDNFKDNIEEVVYTQEEPFGSTSIFMQYFVMKRANELGCKVMLDGQGGDETLLGYEKYYPAIYIYIYKKLGIFRTLKEINKSNKNNSKMTMVWIFKYVVGSLFAKLRKKEYKRRTSFLKPHKNQFSFLDDLAKSYTNINRLQEYEIMYTNLPVLLRYEDKNSMRHSIETRLPFLDYKTLENALNIKVEYKIKEGWTKYVLRKIVDKSLPKSVVWRKNKLGFNAPENIWMKDIDDIMKNQINQSEILGDIAYLHELINRFEKLDNRLKWRLYNVSVWEKVYNVKSM